MDEHARQHRRQFWGHVLWVAIVFLAVGSIFNVLIAWLCVYYKPPAYSVDQNTVTIVDPAAPWRDEIDPRGAPFIEAIRTTGVGVQDTTYFSREPDDADPAPIDQTRAVELKCGWPLLCLTGGEWDVWIWDRDARRYEHFEHEITAVIDDREPILGRIVILPYGVIPHTFAANTIVYASVLWSVLAWPFVIQRRLRVRRGLCPRCAYPYGVSPVCSECGRALPARARTNRRKHE
jgi:hypothetical protein